jgi:hypothetical protein
VQSLGPVLTRLSPPQETHEHLEEFHELKHALRTTQAENRFWSLFFLPHPVIHLLISVPVLLTSALTKHLAQMQASKAKKQVQPNAIRTPHTQAQPTGVRKLPTRNFRLHAS